MILPEPDVNLFTTNTWHLYIFVMILHLLKQCQDTVKTEMWIVLWMIFKQHQTLSLHFLWYFHVNRLGTNTDPCGFWCLWLTHWGRVTHICVSIIIAIGSDNGLSPNRRQAIIWTNAGILSSVIRPSGTNISELLIEIHIFSFKKMHLKLSSGKWRPFCLTFNVLTISFCILVVFLTRVFLMNWLLNFIAWRISFLSTARIAAQLIWHGVILTHILLENPCLPTALR